MSGCLECARLSTWVDSLASALEALLDADQPALARQRIADADELLAALAAEQRQEVNPDATHPDAHRADGPADAAARSVRDGQPHDLVSPPGAAAAPTGSCPPAAAAPSPTAPAAGQRPTRPPATVLREPTGRPVIARGPTGFAHTPGGTP